jgi:hypothetical protein
VKEGSRLQCDAGVKFHPCYCGSPSQCSHGRTWILISTRRSPFETHAPAARTHLKRVIRMPPNCEIDDLVLHDGLWTYKLHFEYGFYVPQPVKKKAERSIHTLIDWFFPSTSSLGFPISATVRTRHYISTSRHPPIISRVTREIDPCISAVFTAPISKPKKYRFDFANHVALYFILSGSRSPNYV